MQDCNCLPTDWSHWVSNISSHIPCDTAPCLLFWYNMSMPRTKLCTIDRKASKLSLIPHPIRKNVSPFATVEKIAFVRCIYLHCVSVSQLNWLSRRHFPQASCFLSRLLSFTVGTPCCCDNNWVLLCGTGPFIHLWARWEARLSLSSTSRV